MTHDSDPDLTRLADAVEAYIEHRAGGDAESVDEALDRNAGVRDLLGPMLDDRPGDPVHGDPNARRLGDYRLVREIGRGGMGVVYEAVEESLGRRVALKVLAGYLTPSERQVERFRREAAAAARLSHRAIVPVHAIGEHEGTHFIAMELIEGRSLRRLVDEVRERCAEDPSKLGDGTLGTGGAGYFDQVAEVTAQVAEALAYSHANDVVHRDIKPQNILVSAEGRICVVDFGLAKDLDSESLSMTGDFAGTPQYVSPEQAAGGSSGLDGRTDVFSLGVVLYELLTLALPFDGHTSRQVLDKITGVEPRPPRALSPHVPRDLETICLKALEKEPRRRYTAEDLALDLRRHLRREPITARPIGRPARAWRYARRHKAQVAAGMLAFLLFVVTPTVGSVYFKLARDEIAEKQSQILKEKDRAQTNLRHARLAVDHLFRRMAQYQLHDLPHTEEFRRHLMSDARRFYARFVELSGDDPEVRVEAARAHAGLGMVDNALGRLEDTVRHVTQAIALITPLTTADDVPATVVINCAEYHIMRGQARIRLGQHSDVRTDLARAEDLLSRLMPGDDLGDELQWLLRAQGDLLKVQSESASRLEPTSEAVEYASRAVDVWTRLTESWPMWGYKALLAQSRVTLGGLLVRRGRMHQAVDLLTRASTEFDELLEQRPRYPVIRHWQARAWMGLADALLTLGKDDQSDVYCDRSIAAFEALTAEFPSTPSYRQEQLRLELSRVNRFINKGQFAKVAGKTRKLLRNARRAVERGDPDRFDRLHLAEAYTANANIDSGRSTRDADSIERQYATAIELFEGLIADFPGDRVALERKLAGSYSDRGRWRLTADIPQIRAAVEDVRKAMRLQRGVLAVAPNDRTARIFMRVHCRVLTLAARRTQDPGLLEEAARGSLDVDETAQAARTLALALHWRPLPEDQRLEKIRTQVAEWLAVAYRQDRNPALLKEPVFRPLTGFAPFDELVRASSDR